MLHDMNPIADRAARRIGGELHTYILRPAGSDKSILGDLSTYTNSRMCQSIKLPTYSELMMRIRRLLYDSDNVASSLHAHV